MKLSKESLVIDVEREVARIAEALRGQVLGTLRRRGAVVGMSGGIDSSAVAALCARAFGPEKVVALFMPERASSDDALRLGKACAEALGITRTVVEDLAPALAGARCYERQREAIQQVIPEFTDAWRYKLVLPSILESDRLNVTRLVVAPPGEPERSVRLTPQAYLTLVAATNYKQRLRTVTEYFHADANHYAVAGTPNRLEYDQGFFVKGGDGLADVKPIAHLYKTQVYAIAAHLGVPKEILERPPTTDTFSLPQGQDEFYFSLPYDKMDLCLYALDHGVSAAETAGVVGLTAEQVERVFRDIQSKRRGTRPLHLAPLLVEEVPSVHGAHAEGAR